MLILPNLASLGGVTKFPKAHGLTQSKARQVLETFLSKGQVALEGNFTFVLDKFDLKSASDKKFVRRATVALKNKICEQNTTPCCERLVISAHS